MQPATRASSSSSIVERPVARRGRMATAVLRGLHRTALAVDREAVEARVVHPDPDRQPVGGEACTVRREVRDLLPEDGQRQCDAERLEQRGRPGVGRDDDPSRAPGLATRLDHDLAGTRLDAGDRCRREQARAVRHREPLMGLGRARGGCDPA